MRKLTEYVLNPNHDEGGHKAKLLSVALGITIDQADHLRALLLRAVQTHEAEYQTEDQYGVRYRIDFPVDTAHGQENVRSGWVIRHGEDFPRLTTCWVMKRKRSDA
jgi:hypothetical protein